MSSASWGTSPRACALASVLLGFASIASPVCAQDARIRVDGCAANVDAQVRSILPVELDAMGDGPLEAHDAELFMECDAAGARVGVRWSSGRTVVDRFDSATVAQPGFARRAALTLVEVLAASRGAPVVEADPEPEAEPVIPPEPTPAEPAEPPDPIPEPEPTFDPTPLLRFGVGARVSVLGSPLLALFGVGARVDVALTSLPWLRVGVDADALFGGRVDVAQGSVDVTAFSVAPRVSLSLPEPMFRPFVGVGYRFGGVLFDGAATNPGARTSSELLGWSGPSLAAGVDLVLGPVGVMVAAELGYVVADALATVDGAPVVSFGGVFASFDVGLSF